MAEQFAFPTSDLAGVQDEQLGVAESSSGSIDFPAPSLVTAYVTEFPASATVVSGGAPFLRVLCRPVVGVTPGALQAPALLHGARPDRYSPSGVFQGATRRSPFTRSSQYMPP